MAMVTVSDEHRQVIKNLYLSGIEEEFIALQLDLEIPVVINILEEQRVHNQESPLP
jgi:hypothetical protein